MNKSTKIISIISAILFLITAYLVITNQINSLNLTIQSILSNPSPSSISFFNIITNIFSPLVLSILALIIIFILYKKNEKRKAIFLFLGMFLSLALTELFSFIIKNPRPLEQLIKVSGYGFPSGHTAAVFAFLISLLVVFHSQIKSKKYYLPLTILAVILIILGALARLVLNVHWFSDILGSIFLSTFAISIAYRYFKN